MFAETLVEMNEEEGDAMIEATMTEHKESSMFADNLLDRNEDAMIDRNPSDRDRPTLGGGTRGRTRVVNAQERGGTEVLCGKRVTDGGKRSPNKYSSTC